jgi:hypothetical protein
MVYEKSLRTLRPEGKEQTKTMPTQGGDGVVRSNSISDLFTGYILSLWPQAAYAALGATQGVLWTTPIVHIQLTENFQTMVTSSQIEFLQGTYSEDQGFLVLGQAEPRSRSQRLVFHLETAKKWHIKVTFAGVTQSAQQQNGSVEKPRKAQRRLDFQAFISWIDFERIALLDDDVTEILLEKTDSPPGTHRVPGDFRAMRKENTFAHIANSLVYTAREDPSKVRYPQISEEQSTSLVLLSIISKREKLASGVFLVDREHEGALKLFVFKGIERPFYEPYDTAIIEQEIVHLKQLRGVSTIIQLVALVVSDSPYLTSAQSKSRKVLRGILLEYHSGGTLQDVIDNGVFHPVWYKWPLQIANALRQLHSRLISHGDLKPSNVVFDADGNAVVIDISGIGGATYGWIAPEIIERDDRLSLSWETRAGNDIWAYGKMMSMIAAFGDDENKVNLLLELSKKATNEDPARRITIPTIISRLEDGFRKSHREF